MNSLSVSFTLGKASSPNNVNLLHNNRSYIANNVDVSKISDNITYKNESVEDAYRKLFSSSVDEYNQKQSVPCRRIKNYFEHIMNSKREEAYYEIIVQFGDVDTAACGTESGSLCKQMLDEYIKNFKNRNPNLYVFCSVMHLDEATPHLHIDFIPFYTQGRKNGPSKGVSMKAALNEQGFIPESIKQNQLIAWEESERTALENILNCHGIEREDKNAHYKHMTVLEYKNKKDAVKAVKRIEELFNVSDLDQQEILKMKMEMSSLKHENSELKKEKDSPYRSFFYSSHEKQEFVLDEIRRRKIPVRETENGFDVKVYYIDAIREIEKSFVPVGGNAREKLREVIDKALMQSEDFNEFLDRLAEKNYEIRKGKYIAARPQGAKNFIRFKSFGEHYSELGLRNSLANKKKFEAELDQKISDGENKNSDITILRVMRFYTISFRKGELPCRRIHKDKPFTWKNDEVLDGLIRLNNKINEGVTLEKMRLDFAEAEKKCTEIEKEIAASRNDLNFFLELREQAEVLFEGKHSYKFSFNQAKETFAQHKNINRNNYQKLDDLIEDEKINIKTKADKLEAERKNLKEASDNLTFAEKVFGGTYIQSLVLDELYRKNPDFIDMVRKSM